MFRITASLAAALVLFLPVLVRADGGRPKLSGKWTAKDFVLVIDEQGQKIHIKEARGTDPKEDDITELTCGATGQDCPMQDGKDKASASVYYNGPVLVVWKTHGRKGDSVAKQRFSLSPEGDSLILEVTHIDPEGKPEKLVLSKQP